MKAGICVLAPPTTKGHVRRWDGDAAADRLLLRYLTLRLFPGFIPEPIGRSGRSSAARTHCSHRPRTETHRFQDNISEIY